MNEQDSIESAQSIYYIYTLYVSNNNTQPMYIYIYIKNHNQKETAIYNIYIYRKPLGRGETHLPVFYFNSPLV